MGIDISNGAYLPPQAIEVEEAVLGAALLSESGLDEMMMLIKSADVFYKEENKSIYKAISTLFASGDPVDILTVSQRLKALGLLEKAGGDYRLIQLTQKVSSSAHVEYHCRIILQKFVAREIIKFNVQTTALAYDESTDVFELMRRLQNNFDEISNITITGVKSQTFGDNLNLLGKRIEFLSQQSEAGSLSGVTTGFKRVDHFTSGYQPQELIILAARPGMGKTSKVLKTAVENAKAGNAVGFISLEMSAMQLTARTVAIDTNFHLSQLVKHGFEKKDYFVSFAKHSYRMSNYPLYIDDSADSDINSVVLKARYWKRKYDIKLLIIDYLQLMTASSGKSSGNREQEISTISRRLKMLAKELDIPVIALSQLSRAVETRGSSKRPLLSDLRESGAIEQDADIIEFLFRPGYYNIDINDNQEFDWMVSEGSDTELIFAKYRNGSVATTGLKWIGDKTKYVDPTDVNEFVSVADEYNDKPIDVLGSVSDAFGDSSVSNELPEWLK